VQPGQKLELQGYAYSGAGLAVIRVDISLDFRATWFQAAIERACETQGIRSGRAWAWEQWKCEATMPKDAKGALKIANKGVDDQYNQQPHDPSPIWNLRGILNTSWGQTVVNVGEPGLEIGDEARSGDGSVVNVGIKMNGKFKSPVTNQTFDSQHALDLHLKYPHDPKKASNVEE